MHIGVYSRVYTNVVDIRLAAVALLLSVRSRVSIWPLPIAEMYLL